MRTREALIDHKFLHRSMGKSEIQACLAVVKEIERADPSLYRQADEATTATTYTTRRYGSECYTWAHHPNLGILDPWPAIRFPRAVLMFDHLLSLVERR